MGALPTPRFFDPSTPPNIVTLTLLAGLSALSMNVFLPSLPEMAEYFDTDYRLMQLSVAIYLSTNAILQIVLGPISDRLGRRPVFLFSVIVYIFATIGCIYASNVVVFLAFRMVQAVIVTGFVLTRAVVRDMVPVERAASMIAYVTMGMALVPMIAPAIGGYLAQFYGWTATFWLQVGLGLAVLVLVWRDLGETNPSTKGSFADQLRAYPGLLGSPRFWGYSLSAMCAAGCFYAYLGGAPFIGSEFYHLDTGLLGFLFGAPAIGYLTGNFLAGRYSERVGINLMILAGGAVTLAGLVLVLVIDYSGLSNAWLFFGLMSFVGMGNGMALPNANSGMLSVRPELAGSASGLGGAMMIGGGAALSAIVGTQLTVESGPAPMLWLMFASASCSILAVVFVMARERRISVPA